MGLLALYELGETLKRIFGSNSRAIKTIAATAVIPIIAAACGSGGSSSGATSGSSSSSKAPSSISIGTLYASSGSFSVSSLAEYDGLKFWINQENKKGGAYIGAYKKRIPLKLVSYNDQSSTSTASTLYNQLITQNKVNILVADFGSVLTAPAVTIAQEHKMLLFDPSGSGASFFKPSDKYLVLTSLPTSAVWPDPLAKFILSKKITKVAIVYGSNDFDASQAKTLTSQLKAGGVTPVYNQAVPTSTSSYGSIIQAIAAKKPQAVLELGYDTNDIAFLQGIQSAGLKFPMVFTAFPGQLHHVLEQNVGEKGLAYTYSYGFPPQLSFNNVNIGLGTKAFVTAYQSANPSAPVNFLNVAGYNTGLAIEAALKNATSMNQLDLRNALVAQSGKLNTIEGNFKLDSTTGAQIGELLPVSQLVPNSAGTNTKIEIVYPTSKATAKAVYPAP